MSDPRRGRNGRPPQGRGGGRAGRAPSAPAGRARPSPPRSAKSAKSTLSARSARSAQSKVGSASPSDPAGRPSSPESPSRPGGARHSNLTGRAAILALVLAALVVSYASSLRAWAEQRSRIDELRTEAAERQKRVGELERELERWNDPAYVEAQARERFGWVMPGETGYAVVGEDGEPTTPGGTPKRAEPDPAGPAWWSTLWGSVETAGNPPKPKVEQKRPEPAATIDPDATPRPTDDSDR